MNGQEKMNALEKVIAGRVRLLFKTVFFGSIATHLQLREVPDLDPPTMATDGRLLFFHPEFVEKIGKSEMEFVLAHEVMHLVLLSHLRRGNRDPKLWNFATDYAINLLLKDEGFKLLPDVLIDEKFRDWSAEKIYNYFQDNPDQQPQVGDSSWNIGGVMDAGTGGEDGTPSSGPGMTAEQIAGEISKMKAQIQAAVQAARKVGNLPGSIERLVEEICAPKASWQEILRRFADEQAFNDYNFSKCNTRILFQTGIITPTLESESLGKLALIVDTSGSVRNEELAQFAGEINSILEQYSCEVTVIYCDTKVNRIDEYTQEDLPLQLHTVGGGGTSMKPSFDWIRENIENPAAIILYSDSYLSDWDKIVHPGCPTLMACTEKQPRAPEWIEVVDISE